MYKLVQLLALATVVVANDLAVGSKLGDKVFEQKLDASPALFWRQVKNVTVNATEGYVISHVVITDLRPEKDGEAVVVEGGEGQKNVTIELKSPAVLRGFEFNVEVYAVPEKEMPVSTTSAAVTPENEHEPKVPISVADPSEDISRNTRKTHEEADESTKVFTSDRTVTPAVETQSTPVASTTKVTKNDDPKINFPVNIGRDLAASTESNESTEKEADVVNPVAVQNQPTHLSDGESTPKTPEKTVTEATGLNPPRNVRDATVSTTEAEAISTTGLDSTTELVSSTENASTLPQLNLNVKPVDVIKPIGNEGLSPPKTIGSDNVAVHSHASFKAPMPYNH